MPITYHVHVENVEHDQLTGHIVCHCRVIEIDENNNEIKGALESHGIDPVALERLYGNGPDAITKWRDHFSRKMLGNHQVRRGARTEILTWHGKRFQLQQTK